MPNNQVTVKDVDVVQGKIFWLPVEEDLPRQAVKRAHSTGVVEGIYGHPVVVVSRPAEDSHIAHFQVISSRQRRTLGDLYNKSNEFHISLHTSYLPIVQSPDHSHASLIKTIKRSSTLQLANGARLQLDSHVNIRNVYKIDWSLLKEYTNPETPDVKQFYFDRESTTRLLAKSAILTTYEPGAQHQTLSSQTLESTNLRSVADIMPALQRSVSEPMWVSAEDVRTVNRRRFSESDICSAKSFRYSEACSSPSNLQLRADEHECRSKSMSEAQKDTVDEMATHGPMIWDVKHPLDCLWRHVTDGFKSTTITRSHLKKREKSQIWVNAKGVMAVIIASI
ncbi:hypothetical protein COCMIDRAFT_82845 [Bipolaris oryzae ATCC 44560]|uniref:Uncharacterized protein n=1 Tax=Bipolaris oryzae ATCC 44560 TaxID=930090 RepID=W6ZJ55_COCMI|nr:uncharacterized protein COCMIDRAFT_82845 [Bipolaris oryzae ATCC 44560]EUC50070.1 hypothetical protein COCMIDRAFT_82845 [Bipolaris oryzae ATCC 44560]